MTTTGESRTIIERERAAALGRIASAPGLAELDAAEVAALGRKAPMSDLKRGIGALPEDDRRAVGRLLNEARVQIETALAARRTALAEGEESRALRADAVDVTLPGRTRAPGHPHPISLVWNRIVSVFIGMGYRIAEGPELETDWFNFEALNMPPDHPARSEFDTLYLEGSSLLLRTHTSPVQIRAMRAQPPPIYIIAPGRAYRRDAFDARHTPVFHQVEGLAVDREISFADLKGTLHAYARSVFGPSSRVRFRPSYFPFTEPSAEVDAVCPACEGSGCSTCSRSGWIELGGAGMVHPNVLRAGGYDPRAVSGFAFGVGIERAAMRLFGVSDIRQFWENDMRFLARFAG